MLRATHGWLGGCLWLLACAAAAAASEDDALQLPPSTEPAPQTASPRSLKLFSELVAGRVQQRYGLGSDDVRRASLDLAWSGRLGPAWRAVLSDRLDDMHPVDEGSRSSVNTLREAYLAWQSEGAQVGVELGRVNYRNGPAYGFNPTDFFRNGASRVATSVDPLAQRENRQGTVMLKAQYVGDVNSLTLAFAPKLTSERSNRSWSMDLGATNHSDRWLAAWSGQAGQGTSVQALAFYERRVGLKVGASASTLIGDSVVAFAEWARGRDARTGTDPLASATDLHTRDRAVAGATYTTPWRTAITAEFEYNGFAISKGEWQSAVRQGGIESLIAYQTTAQIRQDIASRRAILLYASHRGTFTKQLELTALLRQNLDDRSRFAWFEARYHLPRIDVALQWQANLGKADSEFGGQPAKSLVQVLVAAYF